MPIDMLAAAFKKGGVGRASRELMLASRDFLGGRFSAERGGRVTDEERAALAEAVRRGVIDKSQSHDLAGVGEVGVEPDAGIVRRGLRATSRGAAKAGIDFDADAATHRWVGAKQKAMEGISFLFHHAERANREITFLAAYRMAKADGLVGEDAIDMAGSVTWKTHFDYANTSRPRLMQSDTAKVLLVFRNFQINMLWRLFRDAHQAFRGESAEVRREARGQLIGISGMLMLHAGIKGVWGYALLMGLLSLLPGAGDKDDLEDEIQTALVNTFGPFAAGLMLNGVPGTITGTALTQRLGLPELWFRENERNLEGEDAFQMRLAEGAGAAFGILGNVYRGTQQIGEGQVWRGVETMAPKFARDLMKAVRYQREGLLTTRGDVVSEGVSVGDAIRQAIGFSPARVAEQYTANTHARNRQNAIQDTRSRILAQAVREMQAGGISQGTLDDMAEFRAQHPRYPIKMEHVRQSLRQRRRYSSQTVGGVWFNPKLADELQARAAAPIYGN